MTKKAIELAQDTLLPTSPEHKRKLRDIFDKRKDKVKIPNRVPGDE